MTQTNKQIRTPGPWAITQEHTLGFYIDGDHGHRQVASADRESDARLIAVAPDLLAIVEFINEFVDANAPSIHLDALVGASDNDTLRNAIPKIIAKANGR